MVVKNGMSTRMVFTFVGNVVNNLVNAGLVYIGLLFKLVT